MVKIIKADFGFSKTAFDDFIKIMIPEAEGVKFSAITKVESEEKIEIEIEGNGKKLILINKNYNEFADEQKVVMFKTGIMKIYGNYSVWN